MKRWLKTSLLAFVAICACSQLTALAAPDRVVQKIGLVNFKTCVEQSKIGQQEQANFEAMKKQVEKVLEEKEKGLTELTNKFNDPDYLDSLAPEAEAELKHKFRVMNQELAQQQQQYYQVLSQNNTRIVQQLGETVGAAAKEVAKQMKLDLILNEEAAFFHAPDLDISPAVIAEMNKNFDLEQQKPKQ